MKSWLFAVVTASTCKPLGKGSFNNAGDPEVFGISVDWK